MIGTAWPYHGAWLLRDLYKRWKEVFATKVCKELHQQITIFSQWERVISSPKHQRESNENEHVKFKDSILESV
jgi:hypothetical protein